jgi:hypothetical protein
MALAALREIPPGDICVEDVEQRETRPDEVVVQALLLSERVEPDLGS